jgi:Domain of unknown function (DUF1735)
MKRNNIDRIFKLGVFSLVMAVIGSSCVKSREGRTDFDNLKPTVLIPEGGISNFKSGALLPNPTDDADTVYFHVNYAATDVAPTDLVVTIAVDQDALTAYNALGGNQYAIFPDSIFSFTTTTVTIPKGANYSAGIPLIIFPVKIDLLNNYMLPISITVAPAGSTISTNFKTLYYHLIGNPIAGLYTQEWIRYNTATQTGTPAFDLDLSPGVFAPIDGTTVTALSGTGISYVITFKDSAGVLIDFGVAFDPADVAANGGGITITGGPTIITADPKTGSYEFNFTYTNSAGSPRNITDIFGK